ncbi:hypothetical protein HDU76_007524 [Blyttiomyces sp. JEL0837]|nr:hypothetical protein HDU76_007524 [Blyttiomyces sp. JEL0837]
MTTHHYRQQNPQDQQKLSHHHHSSQQQVLHHHHHHHLPLLHDSQQADEIATNTTNPPTLLDPSLETTVKLNIIDKEGAVKVPRTTHITQPRLPSRPVRPVRLSSHRLGGGILHSHMQQKTDTRMETQPLAPHQQPQSQTSPQIPDGINTHTNRATGAPYRSGFAPARMMTGRPPFPDLNSSGVLGSEENTSYGDTVSNGNAGSLVPRTIFSGGDVAVGALPRGIAPTGSSFGFAGPLGLSGETATAMATDFRGQSLDYSSSSDEGDGDGDAVMEDNEAETSPAEQESLPSQGLNMSMEVLSIDATASSKPAVKNDTVKDDAMEGINATGSAAKDEGVKVDSQPSYSWEDLYAEMEEMDDDDIDMTPRAKAAPSVAAPSFSATFKAAPTTANATSSSTTASSTSNATSTSATTSNVPSFSAVFKPAPAITSTTGTGSPATAPRSADSRMARTVVEVIAEWEEGLKRGGMSDLERWARVAVRWAIMTCERLDDCKVLGIVGYGSNGVVLSARHKTNPSAPLLAVKIIYKYFQKPSNNASSAANTSSSAATASIPDPSSTSSSSSTNTTVPREISILCHLTKFRPPHPNVMGLVEGVLALRSESEASAGVMVAGGGAVWEDSRYWYVATNLVGSNWWDTIDELQNMSVGSAGNNDAVGFAGSNVRVQSSQQHQGGNSTASMIEPRRQAVPAVKVFTSGDGVTVTPLVFYDTRSRQHVKIPVVEGSCDLHAFLNVVEFSYFSLGDGSVSGGGSDYSSPGGASLVEVGAMADEFASGGSCFSGKRKGLLPSRWVRDIFQQICSAIEWLHARGVVHGDLKEENVMIELCSGDGSESSSSSSLSQGKLFEALLSEMRGGPAVSWSAARGLLGMTALMETPLRVTVVDFGNARHVREAEAWMRQGSFLYGTPQTTSPEAVAPLLNVDVPWLTVSKVVAAETANGMGIPGAVGASSGSVPLSRKEPTVFGSVGSGLRHDPGVGGLEALMLASDMYALGILLFVTRYGAGQFPKAAGKLAEALEAKAVVPPSSPGKGNVRARDASRSPSPTGKSSPHYRGLRSPSANVPASESSRQSIEEGQAVIRNMVALGGFPLEEDMIADSVEASYMDLLKGLLAPDPTRRFKIEDVVRHAYLSL